MSFHRLHWVLVAGSIFLAVPATAQISGAPAPSPPSGADEDAKAISALSQEFKLLSEQHKNFVEEMNQVLAARPAPPADSADAEGKNAYAKQRAAWAAKLDALVAKLDALDKKTKELIDKTAALQAKLAKQRQKQSDLESIRTQLIAMRVALSTSRTQLVAAKQSIRKAPKPQSEPK